MFDINNIYEPNILEEALDILDKENIKVIAGGTDVLISLHHGKLSEVDLLSLRNIKSLRDIKKLENGDIEIGAMSTFSDLFRSNIINDNIPVLAEAAVSMGGPQIRNMATVGGNICNGAVSADSAPTLFTLNSKLLIKSKGMEKIVPIKDFYLGPGKVDLASNEMLVKIIINENDYKNFYGNYIKFSNRKAMDISMLGVTVLGSINEDKFTDLRIALGVAAPTPVRCIKAEEYSKGLRITSENIEKISEMALLNAKPRNSWRGTKDFREHLIKELTKRGILKVIERAGGKIYE